MKAIIYTRVSTDEQFAENQLPDLKATIQRRGVDLIGVYTEQESAWKAGHQRELARILDEAETGKFDQLYVWALDRLSREGPLQTLLLIHRLRIMGVQVISLKEPWTEAPGDLSDLLTSIVAWVSQMESKRRSERTKAGMARARAEGKQIGRRKGQKDRRKRVRRPRIVVKLLGRK